MPNETPSPEIRVGRETADVGARLRELFREVARAKHRKIDPRVIDDWQHTIALAIAEVVPDKAIFGSTGISCDECGCQHYEFSAPSWLWNQVMRPDGKEHDREYLCLACFLAHVATQLSGRRDERERLIRVVEQLPSRTMQHVSGVVSEILERDAVLAALRAEARRLLKLEDTPT